MTTYHEAAQIKQARRRNAAQAPGKGFAGDQLEALNKIGEVLFGSVLGKSDRDYETAAVGHLVGRLSRILIVACKGVTAPSLQAVQNAARPFYGDIPDFGVHILQDAVSLQSEEPNLHAEMAIVQRVVGLGVTKNELPRCGLQIACIQKGVCPDCSGWLTRHNIPHTWTRKTVATNGWVHPLSGAKYKGKGNELSYLKVRWVGFPLTEDVMDTARSKQTVYPNPERLA
jgi:hypothetical protein